MTNQEDFMDEFDVADINDADKELKTMTPQDLLTLKENLSRTTAALNMPEAVAICFTEVYTPTGHTINITCRGMTGKQALDELANTLRYAKDAYGMSTVKTLPDAPVEPVYENIIQHPIVTPAPPVPAMMPNYVLTDIDVTSITKERKRDGTGDFLRVRGGMYTKFGAPAYDNSYPQGLDLTKFTYGIEVAPPANMAHARIQAEKTPDGKTSKARVMQFF